MLNKWLEAAKKVRNIMDTAGAMLNDEQALKIPDLYRKWDETSSYVVNERRLYEGILYRCLTAHEGQADWTPTNAPSLWAKVLVPEENVIPAWEQPDSTNTYKTGDKVTHNNKIWVSSIDNNSWEPGVFGWIEIGGEE